MTREEWLERGVEGLKPVFTAAGHAVPQVRVSVGFPSKGATSRRQRRIGECWNADCAADHVNQIFISPVLGNADDVLETLAHEVCHAVLPAGTGHKNPFKQLARAIGLEGKATATTAGPILKATLERLADSIGAFPHAELDATSLVKKQTTRLLKLECGSCSFICRATRGAIDECGYPSHCDEAMTEAEK